MTDLTIDRLAAYAGEAAFDRGHRYFRAGRVLSWTAENGSLRGRVKGSDQYPYRVEIDLKSARPSVRCTCPFDHEGGAWCKHAVAVAISYCINGATRQRGQSETRGNGNGSTPQRERRERPAGKGAAQSATLDDTRVAPDEVEGDEAHGSRRTRRRRRSRRRRRGDGSEEARAGGLGLEPPDPQALAQGAPAVAVTAARAAVDLGSPLLNIISARGMRQALDSADQARRFRFRIRQSSEGLELVVVDQKNAQQVTGLRPYLAGGHAGASRRKRRGRGQGERVEEIKLRRADEILFQFLLAHAELDQRRKLFKIPNEDAATLLHLLSASGGVFDDWTGERVVFSAEPAKLVLEAELTVEGQVQLGTSWKLPTSDRRLELHEARLFAGEVSWLRVGALACRVTPRASALATQVGIVSEHKLGLDDTPRFLFEVAPEPAPGIEIRLSPEAASVSLRKEEPKVVLLLSPRQNAIEGRLAFEYGSVRISDDRRYVRAGGTWLERDEVAENRARARMSELGFSPTYTPDVYVVIGDAALDFVGTKLAALAKEWEVYGADALGDFRISKKKFDISVDVDMGSGIDWFTLDISAKAGDEVLDIGLLQHALLSGERYIKLSDGSHVEVPRERLAKLSEAINSVSAQPEPDGSFRVHLFEANELAERLGDGDGLKPTARFRQFLKKLQGFEGIGRSEPPKTLKATLRPYQTRGLDWLWFLNRYNLGGVLADDMGLGKTVQALALLLKSKKMDGKKPSLVVVPASVVVNWQEESARFAPSLKVLDLTGPSRMEKFDEIGDYDLVVTNYALLRRDIERLREIEFRYVILDEAQNIKNPESQTARASKMLRADHRLALTGTPIENRLSELWSIFDFLNPGLLGSLNRFRQQFEVPIVARGDREAEQKLRRRVYPFILRRMKKEVAQDLPDKIESVVHCELLPEQRALYRDLLALTRKQVFDEVEEKGIARSHISILAALVKLRQVCCHPKLLKLPVEDEKLVSAKLDLLQEMVHELISEGHRALIFSQFTEMLAIIREWLDQEQIEYEYLDGSTKDRATPVKRFNEDETIPLFLVSLKAGGTGLNLTGADYVIHYDPWWNPAVEDQATDRAYRIGQTRNVFAYKLIAKGTVEDKLLELQSRKRDLVAGVLGAETSIGKSLTREDLEDLFTLEE